MKCWVILINRGRGKLYKKGKFEALTGEVKRGFREKLAFQIADKSKPLEMELRGRNTVPLWLVNEKTLQALTIEPNNLEDVKFIIHLLEKETLKEHIKPEQMEFLKYQLDDKIKTMFDATDKPNSIMIAEHTDADAHIKLNLLTKKEFWRQVAMHIKLTLVETLIYLGAGYGIFRFAEYFLTIIFRK